jgi:GST-like protein
VDKRFTVFGAAGSGSVSIEAALTLLGLPYEVVEGASWDGGEAALKRIATVNPMRQVPALVLPNGEVMTEAAAILIWLADSHPQSGLSPGVDDARRPAFLRWMSFVASSIYAFYWMRDDPARVAPDEASQDFLLRRTAERIAHNWGVMEAQTDPGRYILGDDLTVLDLFVTVTSRYRPRRERFYQAAPRLGEVVRRVDADPRLTAFWDERYPFEDGWDELSEV